MNELCAALVELGLSAVVVDGEIVITYEAEKPARVILWEPENTWVIWIDRVYHGLGTVPDPKEILDKIELDRAFLLCRG